MCERVGAFVHMCERSDAFVQKKQKYDIIFLLVIGMC